MKKILLFLSLAISVSAHAQKPPNYTKISQRYNWVSGMYDSIIIIPKDTAYRPSTAEKLLPSIRAKGDTLYIWSTGQNKYVAVGDGVGSGLGSSDVGTLVQKAAVSNVAALRASTLHTAGFSIVETIDFSTTGDKGSALYEYVDTCTHTDDTAFFIQVASGGGYHLKIKDATLNLAQIGAKPDWTFNSASVEFAFDNWPIIMKALRFVDAYPGLLHNIIIPSASNPATSWGCFFSKEIPVHQPVKISGESGGGINEKMTTVMFYGTAGFKFYYPNPGDVVLYSGRYYQVAAVNYTVGNAPSGTASNNTWWTHLGTSYGGLYSAYSASVTYYGNNYGTYEAFIENLYIRNIVSGGLYQQDGELHGVFSNTRLHSKSVWVYAFKGDGFHQEGNVADVPYFSNASGWTSAGCFAQYCAGNGYFIKGGDANTFDLINFKASSNKYWGVLDSSLLGGNIVKPDLHNNGIYGISVATNSRAWVSHTGGYYFARRNSLNQPPTGTTAHNDYWTYVGATDAYGLSIPWNADTLFKGAGALGILRGFSTVSGPYIEDGSIHSMMPSTSILTGGFSLTPVFGAWLQGSQSPEYPYGVLTSGLSGMGTFKAQRFTWSDGGINADDGFGNSLLDFTKPTLFRFTNGLYLGTAGVYRHRLHANGNMVFNDYVVDNGEGLQNYSTFRQYGQMKYLNHGPVLALDTTNYKIHVENTTTGDVETMNWPTGGGGGGTWGSITGTLSGQTDLQSALDAKQPLDADLTTIAGLTATTDNFMQAKSGAWASRTIAQVRADLATGTPDGSKFLKDDWTWGTPSGGGGAPGGADTEVQFNNSGSFGGSSNFKWNGQYLSINNPDNNEPNLLLETGYSNGGIAIAHVGEGGYGATIRMLIGSIGPDANDFNIQAYNSNLYSLAHGGENVMGTTSGAFPIRFTPNSVEVASFLSTGIVFNDPGNDVDFRIESDALTSALAIDGATGNVIIGTLDTDLTAPTTTGTTRMVVSDANGLLSFVENPIVSATRTTTNATVVEIRDFATIENQAGVLTVQLVGLESDGSARITGTKTVSYLNDGTLTIGSIVDLLTTQVDAGLSGASWTIVASGSNVRVEITPVASTTIIWTITATHTYSVSPA